MRGGSEGEPLPAKAQLITGLVPLRMDLEFLWWVFEGPPPPPCPALPTWAEAAWPCAGSTCWECGERRAETRLQSSRDASCADVSAPADAHRLPVCIVSAAMSVVSWPRGRCCQTRHASTGCQYCLGDSFCTALLMGTLASSVFLSPCSVLTPRSSSIAVKSGESCPGV